MGRGKVYCPLLVKSSPQSYHCLTYDSVLKNNFVKRKKKCVVCDYFTYMLHICFTLYVNVISETSFVKQE